jgi:hypothetical protein
MTFVDLGRGANDAAAFAVALSAQAMAGFSIAA